MNVDATAAAGTDATAGVYAGANLNSPEAAHLAAAKGLLPKDSVEISAQAQALAGNLAQAAPMDE